MYCNRKIKLIPYNDYIDVGAGGMVVLIVTINLLII